MARARTLEGKRQAAHARMVDCAREVYRRSCAAVGTDAPKGHPEIIRAERDLCMAAFVWAELDAKAAPE
jgi:hypothetical protein